MWKWSKLVDIVYTVILNCFLGITAINRHFESYTHPISLLFVLCHENIKDSGKTPHFLKKLKVNLSLNLFVSVYILFAFLTAGVVQLETSWDGIFIPKKE